MCSDIIAERFRIYVEVGEKQSIVSARAGRVVSFGEATKDIQLHLEMKSREMADAVFAAFYS